MINLINTIYFLKNFKKIN